MRVPDITISEIDDDKIQVVKGLNMDLWLNPSALRYKVVGVGKFHDETTGLWQKQDVYDEGLLIKSNIISTGLCWQEESGQWQIVIRTSGTEGVLSMEFMPDDFQWAEQVFETINTWMEA
jgi:hypothetical protein